MFYYEVEVWKLWTSLFLTLLILFLHSVEVRLPDFKFSILASSIIHSPAGESSTMPVSAIALYLTPPSGIYTSLYDFRSPEYEFSFYGIRHEKTEPYFSCALSSSFKYRDQSSVSVFQGSISCSGSPARSPPLLKVPRDSNFSDARVEREGLINRCIGNALGSCWNCNSPSIPLKGRFDVEDLTLDLEESSAEGKPCWEFYASELLSGARSRHKIFNEDILTRAFYEAERAHRGQMRLSGDPYLHHCVETAVLLAKIGANSTVVAAGLLHDTIDDSFMDHQYILLNFETSIADLVEEVTKISKLSKLARENNTASSAIEANRLHTIFLAMVDARAVLIKLADRLHNMMTLEALPVDKQRRFAKETLEIFVPLANRLGILSWKEELEDLCFKHLHPQEHAQLSCQLRQCFDESKMASYKQKLEQALKTGDLTYHIVFGRHKSLFSIYSKMIKKNLTVDEIHDIHGLRVIVEKEEDCFRAVDIICQLWPYTLGMLKDYITYPKFNGYKSLHIAVVSQDKIPMEIQIRTKEMHLQAEYGFAAHWRYKEDYSQHSSFVLQMVEWVRRVMMQQCETMDAERPLSFVDIHSIKPSCSFTHDDCACSYSYTHTHQCDHDEPILIIMLENEKMSIQEFGPNSTVMDILERCGRWNQREKLLSFAMKEELRPQLNCRPVNDPYQKLRIGDVVELTPTIPNKSLSEYRKELKRIYDYGLTISTARRGWKSEL